MKSILMMPLGLLGIWIRCSSHARWGFIAVIIWMVTIHVHDCVCQPLYLAKKITAEVYDNFGPGLNVQLSFHHGNPATAISTQCFLMSQIVCNVRIGFSLVFGASHEHPILSLPSSGLQSHLSPVKIWMRFVWHIQLCLSDIGCNRPVLWITFMLNSSWSSWWAYFQESFDCAKKYFW
jgi:hypothetical protein